MAGPVGCFVGCFDGCPVGCLAGCFEGCLAGCLAGASSDSRGCPSDGPGDGSVTALRPVPLSAASTDSHSVSYHGGTTAGCFTAACCLPWSGSITT